MEVSSKGWRGYVLEEIIFLIIESFLGRTWVPDDVYKWEKDHAASPKNSFDTQPPPLYSGPSMPLGLDSTAFGGYVCRSHKLKNFQIRNKDVCKSREKVFKNRNMSYPWKLFSSPVFMANYACGRSDLIVEIIRWRIFTSKLSKRCECTW